MRIRDYIFGKKTTLRSPLSREDIYTRINGSSGSSLNPFGLGVAGWARFGRLNLKIMRGPLQYNARPTLSGLIRDVRGETEFSLRFGAPVLTIFFFGFWYLFVGLLAILLIGAFLTNDQSLNREAFPFAMLVITAFLIGPIAIHIFMTKNSDNELAELLEFLEREVQAVNQSRDMLEDER